MQIRNENVATYGLKKWEQTGTIAIDFANNLDRLDTVNGIDLQNLVEKGWHQVGFRFGGRSLIENNETIHLDIVLSRRQQNEEPEFGFVSRTINKADFLNLVVNFTVYISDQVHFESDEISFNQLQNIEDSD